MAPKTKKSIEEQIETDVKVELFSLGVHPYAKTEEINPEITLDITSLILKGGINYL